MVASLHSPSLANLPADFAKAGANKIDAAIAKERAAPPPTLESSSGGEDMRNELNGHQTNGAEPVRIWKARNFIHAHSSEELSLGQVARAASTSPNYFSEKFKEATGMSFVQYVARARFEKAAQLLRDADLRVSEIAFAVGFQSLSQFNRVFKKLAGLSPTEYRTGAPPGSGKTR